MQRGGLSNGSRVWRACLFFIHQVIDMPEHNPGQMGGTMRLGKRRTLFQTKNSVMSKCCPTGGLQLGTSRTCVLGDGGLLGSGAFDSVLALEVPFLSQSCVFRMH